MKDNIGKILEFMEEQINCNNTLARKEQEKMENLEQYRQRTRGFMMDRLSYPGDLETNPNLRKKVNAQGEFLPFYGDTLIFELNEAAKTMAAKMQQALYENCGEMLALKIAPYTFHITLHDLSSGNFSPELAEQMEENRKRAERILEEKQKRTNRIPEEGMSGELPPIRVRTVSVFSMVNTSVVLGLEPADEDSCFRLMNWYESFQQVVPLNYTLTLHLTLGYYKPGKYSEEQKERLAETFANLNESCGREWELEERNLVYRRFEDMNHYA